MSDSMLSNDCEVENINGGEELEGSRTLPIMSTEKDNYNKGRGCGGLSSRDS